MNGFALSTNELLWATLISLLLGIFFGAVYDVIRIFRVLTGVSYAREKRHFDRLYSKGIKDVFGKIRLPITEGVIVFVTDIIYMIFVTVSFVIFLYACNYGVFRWFFLVSSCIGFLIWYYTFGRIILFFSKEITAVIRLIINICFRLFILPIKLLSRTFKAVFKKTFGRLFTYVKNAIDIGKKNRYTNRCIEEISKNIVFKV